MDKKEFAENVKRLRNSNGFTQEQLAEKSGISLRTIQRIEGGEVNPRSDTIIMLSNTLNVPPSELADWAVKEDRGYLALVNLSAISSVIFPILGIILPLVMWTSRKDKIQGLDRTAKGMINFQITWTIIYFISVVITMVSTVLSMTSSMEMSDVSPTFISGAIKRSAITMLAVYAYNIIFVVINTILSACGRKNFYFPSIPFLSKK